MVAIPRVVAPFVVSAPGKIILFGEHAVVYGKTAIAGSVDMRAYALVTPRKDGKTRLFLPDINVDVYFDSTQLARLSPSSLSHPCEIETQLTGIVAAEGPGRTAILTFAYMYGSLFERGNMGGFTICVRSLLPVGSGLGSSAAFGVVLSTALLQLTGHLKQMGASAEDRKLINHWAYRGEQVAHGTPSGIDNAVATYGGFLAYTRGSESVSLHSTRALRVLITNTQVPKSTKALVASVRTLRERHPEVVDTILDSIHSISTAAGSLFQSHKPCCSELQDIVRLNHGLLATLGVSHPSLERIREITEARGMASKLTGAGGGGCALTLIPIDVSGAAVDRVAQELGEVGFRCYQTVVGGAGVTITNHVDSEPIDKWIGDMLTQHLSLSPSDRRDDKADDYSGIVSGFSILPDFAITALAPSSK
ncbi:mevalonate kinase [Coemansia reversa NRRL 1564]|uniref:Mevalonate kinase n=1 Tax=Coemansia reversa (strain ATCC 12441 / NRRL 1564) TaxID=763665 RepID=A0A2G5BFC2_COERN|nr:mevalonate kinase [Coemansia reversa NRRL 1564]|eukprot:PIA17704.1 mevalonate kinase [Coemansia reversa NRRL 1564]